MNASSLTLKHGRSEPPMEKPIMDRLFSRLYAFYGKKLSEAFPGLSLEAMQEVWTEELSGYSLDEMNRGIVYCRSQQWPPTLPEFLAAARPPIVPEAAFVEAVDNMGRRERCLNAHWSHPAIYHAAIDCGVFDMRRLPYPSIRARWEAALAKQLGAGDWAPIPPAPVALISEARTAGGRVPDAIERLRNKLTRRFAGRDPVAPDTATQQPAVDAIDFVASVTGATNAPPASPV